MQHTAQDNSAPAHQPGVIRRLTGLIGELALCSESVSAFYKTGCSAIVQAFQSPYGAVSARFGAEVLEDYWHTGTTDPNFWKKPVQDVMDASMQDAQPIARRFTSRDAAIQIALISVILRDVSGSMLGVMSLVVRCSDEFPAAMYRELLEALAAQLALGASRIDVAKRTPAQAAPDASLSKAAKYTSGVEMAFALVSSLRSKLGCELAAIGTADGPRVRVQAVSGLDEVSSRAEAVRLMTDAMGEAADRGEPVVYQIPARQSDPSDPGFRVHKRWYDHVGGACLASIPLEAGAGGTMIVSLRRKPELPFSAEEIKTVRTLMEPYAPAFGLIDRANRSLVVHAKKSVAKAYSELLAPRGWGRKAAAVLVSLFVLWVLFGSLAYDVSAPATVRPSVVRHIGAPSEGVLLTVLATAGDRVSEGQVLAVFDDSELSAQRAQLDARARVAQINEDRAISEGKSVDAELARAEFALASAELAEVERRIAQSRIVAPFSGLVLSGDLRERVGETMAMGTPLFEIAQDGGWKLEIEMPQRIAADLAPGRVGGFAPNARPEAASDIQLTRVKPLAEAIGGKTVYIAEAELGEGEEWLRPGMEGMARVNFGRRAVWWVASHRFVDYFRTNFWL